MSVIHDVNHHSETIIMCHLLPLKRLEILKVIFPPMRHRLFVPVRLLLTDLSDVEKVSSDSSFEGSLSNNVNEMSITV